jgi:AAA family ATP:ADP antiporter
MSVFRDEPFLRHIGLLVVLSTAALLVLDYLFKLRVARAIPAADLGHFFARFYTGLNALSIVVQLFFGAALIRRLGVAGAVGFTPFILLLGGVGTLVSGGAILAVLAAKAADGGLRYSLHRVSSELLYLPVSAEARERAKPLLDGAVARGTQALTALSLLGLVALGLGTGRFVTLLLALLTAAWLTVAMMVRKPYLALFRRALASGAIASEAGEGLDLNSAEVLIERLASLDPTQVVAAMEVLDGRRRAGLIPALVLYHTEESVLKRALEIFTDGDRTDWIPLGQRLLRHEREAVRDAALRALVTHGAIAAVEQVAEDWSPRSRAYAAVCLAARDESLDLSRDARVAKLLAEDDTAVRAGILAAIADIGAPPSTLPLLAQFTGDPLVARSEELAALLAAAIAKSGDVRRIPWLVGRLERGDARVAIRTALVALGPRAYEAVAAALVDETLPRRLRAHLPHALASFGTQRAADLLLSRLATDRDGLVRYKALRSLARLTADRREIRVSRRKIEALAYRNLVEHLRLLSLHAFVDEEPDEPTSRLLRGLLEDKLRQSLERVFRLLKIAHRDEDIHRVHLAALGADKRQRANAAEFLDTLLARRDQREMHHALRIVIDDLPEQERVERAAFALPLPPRSRAEAITALIGDADLAVATLATEYAVRHGDHALVEAAQRARSADPRLMASGLRYFAIPKVEVRHA